MKFVSVTNNCGYKGSELFIISVDINMRLLSKIEASVNLLLIVELRIEMEFISPAILNLHKNILNLFESEVIPAT